MSSLEWSAFITGVICVYLLVKEKDINWPIGVLNSLLLTAVFWNYALYAQVGLQIFYVLECLYGWYKWTRRDPTTGAKILRIGTSPASTRLWLATLCAVGTWGCYQVFLKTNDPAPFWDSVVAIGSLAAEYLLCLKLLEGWMLYFAMDLISLVILAQLGQWVTFSTYLVFTGLCALGVFEWLKRLRRGSP